MRVGRGGRCVRLALLSSVSVVEYERGLRVVLVHAAVSR